MARRRRRPRIGIITSASPLGIRDALSSLVPRRVATFELYAFGSEDLKALDNLYDPESPTPGVDPVVDYCANRLVPDIASLSINGWVNQAIPSRAGSGSVWSAIASNIADVSDGDDHYKLPAVAAITNLARLASKLRVPVVEVVAGPSFDPPPVSPGRVVAYTQAHQKHRSPLRTGPAVRARRWDALIRSMVRIEENLEMEHLDVGCAIEIEPGLPYLVNDAGSALSLYSDERVKCLRHWGLNVDCGHLQILLDVDPRRHGSDIKALWNEDMIGRLMHFHCSDHSLGHFCDLEIPTFHMPRTFRKWMARFYRIARSKQRSPYFSNSISIEAEASPLPVQPVRSARALHYWMTEVARSRRITAGWRENWEPLPVSYGL